MTEDQARARLEAVPSASRQSLVSARGTLPSGVLPSVNRFFAALDRRHERMDAPSRGTFEEACRSAPSLEAMLRVLSRHGGDELCLAEGRDLLKEYRARSGRIARTAPSTVRAARPLPEPRGWPSEWMALLPGLLDAPIRDSSIGKHINSINSCALRLPAVRCPPKLSWLLGWELARALQIRGPGDLEPVVRTTAAGHLASLVALGKYGGVERGDLRGLRTIFRSLHDKAQGDPKMKDARLQDLLERGGYEEVIRIIVRLLDEADAAPDWTAEAERARATAAIMMIAVNIPPRTEDVSLWRYGRELEREPWGEWRLDWAQGKNRWRLDAGRLWPETAAVIDLHLLGGRSLRLAHLRYGGFRDRNWLRPDGAPLDPKRPSKLVKAALGVPLHDLRTLTGEYLREHDPARAPDIVQALLGHRARQSGEAYRLDCEDEVGAREWTGIRTEIATG